MGGGGWAHWERERERERESEDERDEVGRENEGERDGHRGSYTHAGPEMGCT